MRFRHLLPVALLALLLALPATASAKPKYRVGIGDQSATVFSDPLFTALKLKRIRYIVPWDWYRDAGQQAEVAAFLTTAHAARFKPFVTFTAHRGCWTGVRYSKRKACKAPSRKRYRRAFKKFRRDFPYVRDFSAWNEVNHKSQPTYRSPRRAAMYYNTMRKACRRKCTIVAADLLDSSNLVRYLRKFKRHAKGKPRIWGLHNYSDVNRKRARMTRRMLRNVRGQVWLTETGGIVSFGRNWPYSQKRAKSRTAYMFKLSDRYSRKRRGMRSRITRIYPYQYTGVERGARFDAGLVNPDGSARPAYKTFKSKVRHRRK
jgi:hypothetical protein